jgi:hypothetical protein
MIWSDDGAERGNQDPSTAGVRLNTARIRDVEIYIMKTCETDKSQYYSVHGDDYILSTNSRYFFKCRYNFDSRPMDVHYDPTCPLSPPLPKMEMMTFGEGLVGQMSKYWIYVRDSDASSKRISPFVTL